LLYLSQKNKLTVLVLSIVIGRIRSKCNEFEHMALKSYSESKAMVA